MTLIRSMEDLQQAKAEALERQRLSAQQHHYQIRVSMGSCGIVVGARDTFDAINHQIASENITGIRVTKSAVLACVLWNRLCRCRRWTSLWSHMEE